MVAHFVSRFHDHPGDLRIALDLSTEHEERRSHVESIERLEDPLGVVRRPVVERQRDGSVVSASSPCGRSEPLTAHGVGGPIRRSERCRRADKRGAEQRLYSRRHDIHPAADEEEGSSVARTHKATARAAS